MNMQLKGVYSALFTIYDRELNIKKDAVHKLMNYHQENGLQGFYVGAWCCQSRPAWTCWKP